MIDSQTVIPFMGKPIMCYTGPAKMYPFFNVPLLPFLCLHRGAQKWDVPLLYSKRDETPRKKGTAPYRAIPLKDL